MYGKGVSKALHWRITVWWRHWTSSFAPIGDFSGAVAWAALHYMAPPGSSVFIGQTPFYLAPAGPHVQTPLASEPRVPLVVARRVVGPAVRPPARCR